MKPYQRHTEMTHHILGYPENSYGYEDEEDDRGHSYRCECHWCSTCYNIDYDYDKDHENMESYYSISRPRWADIKKLPNLYKLSKQYVNRLEVDMLSIYPIAKRRDMVIESILNEDGFPFKDLRNTIGSIVNSPVV